MNYHIKYRTSILQTIERHKTAEVIIAMTLTGLLSIISNNKTPADQNASPSTHALIPNATFIFKK